MVNPVCPVHALYRAYLRQLRKLPLPYLRQFFRIKVYDDCQAIRHSFGKSSLDSKVKRVSKDLRKVEAAVNGNVKAFQWTLDMAYGRKGKLRWEIMKPVLSDSAAQIPPRIIRSVEKSRPPVYSPELTALLTNGYSRKPKGLSSKNLTFPPSLPLQANPSSDDARLLGPFSKRREVNIRWRYFTEEWKKVLPPLQVVAVVVTQEGRRGGTSPQHLLEAGTRGVGLQGHGIFEEIEALAASPKISRGAKSFDAAAYVASSLSKRTRHPSRWLRRRYQELLGRLPILAHSRSVSKGGHTSSTYSVSLSPNAMASSQFDPSRLPEVRTNSDIQWLALAKKIIDEEGRK